MPSVTPRPSPQPVVERIARHIGDPVTRLRFLRVVAPAAVFRRSRRLNWLILMALFTVAAGLLFGGALLWRAFAAAPARLEVRVSSPASHMAATSPRLPEVWQVESSDQAEIYSNGLRIDGRYAVSTEPRAYLAFPVSGGDSSAGVRREDPAGIVFHSSESPQLPFLPGENRELKRVGESLLEYVRRQRAYHFVIDRFGRVYRVVRESDVAYHAGHSVWADDRWLYLNLNESFLGISFEAQTPARGAGLSAEAPAISPAQVRAAAVLTEMLLARYHIPRGNCVTHAQVSVNPANMQAGYHQDWAAGFPFERLGLPNNDLTPLPALTFCGFGYDGFVYDPSQPGRTTGGIYPGIAAAEKSLRETAAARGVKTAEWRKILERQYRQRMAQVRAMQSAGK
ncbi:MAG: N-acetylmuramoyl-L-alanine amidase [Bryobacteraceae bacterium]